MDEVRDVEGSRLFRDVLFVYELEELTGVLSLVGVLLALVEAVLLLCLLDLGVLVVALVTGLVDLRVTDVGVSRHCDVFWSLFGGYRVDLSSIEAIDVVDE